MQHFWSMDLSCGCRWRTTGETVEGGNHANRDLIASFRSLVHGMSGLVRLLEHRRAFGLLLRPNVSRRVMADPRQKPICHLLDRPRTSDPRNYHATRGWVEFFSLDRAPTDSVLRYYAYRRGKRAGWNSMLPRVRHPRSIASRTRSLLYKRLLTTRAR